MGGMKDTLGDTPFVYPLAPGFKEGTTSREAARRVDRPDVMRSRVFDAIERRPSTNEEIARALDLPITSVRPRTTELRLANKIEPDGKNTRINDGGRRTIVWRIRRSQHGSTETSS